MGKSQTSIKGIDTAENVLSPSEEILLAEKGYKILKLIGRGTSGLVYFSELNSQKKSSRSLACKIIDTSKLPDIMKTKFIPRELLIMTKISHPNIVTTYCIYHHTTKYIIFMGYAERGDLLDFILENGEVPEDLMKYWFFQMTLALQYLHTLNIAHRDIKCENVLISSKHNTKLADFGFSRIIVDEVGDLMQSTTYCGSPAYVAPEIIKGEPYFPKITDMWAMGIVLFVALNKSLPFAEEKLKKLLRKQLKKNWKFKTKIKPKVSQEVIKLVGQLLEPDIRLRLTSDELAENPWFTVNNKRLEPTKDEVVALKNAKFSKNKLKSGVEINSGNKRKNSEAGYFILQEEQMSYDSVGPGDSETGLNSSGDKSQ